MNSFFYKTNFLINNPNNIIPAIIIPEINAMLACWKIGFFEKYF